MNRIKYMWMEGSRVLPNCGGFFAALMVHNVPDGIQGVEMLDEGTWYAPQLSLVLRISLSMMPPIVVSGTLSFPSNFML